LCFSCAIRFDEPEFSADHAGTLKADFGNLQALVILWQSKDGRLHRVDGPTFIYRDAATGIVSEDWWKDGKQGRADGPAVIERDASVPSPARNGGLMANRLSHRQSSQKDNLPTSLSR
jgi:hypothetical protein